LGLAIDKVVGGPNLLFASTENTGRLVRTAEDMDLGPDIEANALAAFHLPLAARGRLKAVFRMPDMFYSKKKQREKSDSAVPRAEVPG